MIRIVHTKENTFFKSSDISTNLRFFSKRYISLGQIFFTHFKSYCFNPLIEKRLVPLKKYLHFFVLLITKHSFVKISNVFYFYFYK